MLQDPLVGQMEGKVLLTAVVHHQVQPPTGLEGPLQPGRVGDVSRVAQGHQFVAHVLVLQGAFGHGFQGVVSLAVDVFGEEYLAERAFANVHDDLEITE